MVEIMIALTLLSVLALSTMVAIIPVGRQARLSREIESAATSVRTLLEQAQTIPYNDVPTTFTDGQIVTMPTLVNGQILINIADPTADPMEITFTVTWDSQEVGSFSRTFTTLKTR